MPLEVVGCYRDSNSIKEQCKCNLFYHVVLMMNDGRMMDGIIEEVNDDNITMLVGEDIVDDLEDQGITRQPPGRPNRPNRFRRFGRRNYPINVIGGIGLLPYPYVPPIYPPYPYPYPYYLV